MFASIEEFTAALADLPSANGLHRAAAQERQRKLTKPPGSLGRLEEFAKFLAGWNKSGVPSAERARTVVFAGNHGVTAQRISPYPPEVTTQMVENFKAGGAAINALTELQNVALDVIPLDLESKTGDITVEPALTHEELLKDINAGATIVDENLDVLALGEMGIGNTTIAAALSASCFGGTGTDWAGPGTGLDDAGIERKAAVVDQAIARHTDASSATERLRCLGGHETAAIAGAIVAARHASVPVILDGFVATAAFAPLFCDNPAVVRHCLAGHHSAEPAHGELLSRVGLEPLLDLGMRLGEGTGATLAIGVLRAAAATHNGMATFAEAGISDRADDTPGKTGNDPARD